MPAAVGSEEFSDRVRRLLDPHDLRLISWSDAESTTPPAGPVLVSVDVKGVPTALRRFRTRPELGPWIGVSEDGAVRKWGVTGTALGNGRR